MTDLPAITWPLNAKCVWFPLTGTNPDGTDTYANPVEINCRWDEVTEEMIASNGTKFLSKSKVMVDRRIQEGVLLSCLLIDIINMLNPYANTVQAWKIQKFAIHPDVPGEEALYEVYL